MAQLAEPMTAEAKSKSEPALGWIRRGRLPVLDGLRGFFIITVVLSHAYCPGHDGLLAKVLTRGQVGHLGVNCFFVISGMLITILLLREYDRNGRISLTKFYQRRALRLLPALAMLLLVVFLITQLSDIQIARKYWIAALTYMMSLMPQLHTAWDIAMLWSLSVEEHFYFLWPLIVVLLLPRRAAILAGVYVLLTPLIRYAIYTKLQSRGILDIDYCSPTQMCGIAVGCVLGYLLFYQPQRILRWAKWPGSPLVAIAGMTVSILLGNHWGKFDILFSDPFNSAFLGLMVLGFFCHPTFFLTRFLNSRPMVGLGILSYSLYLWQQPFTYPGTSWMLQWPTNALLALLAAMGSFFLIELPFLRLKDSIGARVHGGVDAQTAPAVEAKAAA